MKTISMIIPSLDIGGTETHLNAIIPELNQRGFQCKVCVFSTPKRSQLFDDLSQHVDIQVLSDKKGVFGLLQLIKNLIVHFKTASPSIAHFFMPKGYLLGMLAHQVARSKAMTVMSRRCQNHYQKKYPILAKIEHLFHRKVDLILTNSQCLSNEVIQQENASHAKVHCVHNGIAAPATAIKSKKKPYPPTQASIVLMKVANFIPYKGHIDLLEALGHIKEHLPEHWCLCCFGHDQQGYLHTLKQQSRQLGLSDNIHWIENEPEAKSYWDLADIAVHCAHEEGFPNAIIEAMASKKPVIASEVGGVPEAISDQKNGLLIPAKNSKMLAGAILELINNPQKRKLFSEQAYHTWLEKFTLETCANQIAQHYHRLLEGV